MMEGGGGERTQIQSMSRERERDRWTRRKTGPLSDRMTGSGRSGKVTFLPS